jgi:hypothetical protein
MKRWFLRNPWNRPLCVFNYAAVKIQALVRRFITRLRLLKKILLSQRNKSTRKSSISLNKKISSKQLDRYLQYLDYSRKMQKIDDEYQPPAWLSGGFSSWSAVRIQSWWRMVASNKRLLRRRRLINQVAAIVIQTCWRNYHYYIPAAEMPATMIQQQREPLNPASAIRKIQLCWRRYCNRRIYYYFRNLILFKLQGAPAELLRTIIPNEADLLDRASGVHVKFRLGGKIFPPKIYFKIFTHRPLCDVNAFAPRDYSQEKPLNDLYVNNRSSVMERYQAMKKESSLKGSAIMKKGGNIRIGVKYFETVVTTTNPVGLSNWYQREDSNNWRPISSVLIEKVETPPWFQDSGVLKRASTKYHSYYHFDKSVRQKDLQTHRRRRKQEWMKKLYKSHLNNNNNDEEDEFDRNTAMVKHNPQKNNSSSNYYYNTAASDSKKNEDKQYEHNSFMENLEYKSQVFFDEKKPEPKKQPYPKILDSKMKDTPFVAPAKGKYSIGDDLDVYDAKSAKGVVTSDSFSTFDEKQQHHSSSHSKIKKNLPVNHDNLLEWSLQLDYDNYVSEWNTIGTSLPSDMPTKTIY